MSDLDTIRECAKGWTACKNKFVADFKSKANRRALLRAWAQDNGLPESVGDQVDDCLSGDDEACAQAAATIGALAACNAATGGACPKCCGVLVGPMLDVLWPIIGPTLEGLAEGASSIVVAGLEWLGVKDSPDFRTDVYLPMRAQASAQWNAMRAAWLAKFPYGAATLEQELHEPAGQVNFYSSWWYPSNYGTVSLTKGSDPWLATWNLEWSKAWERDDAFKSGAEMLGMGYRVRLQMGAQAIARATGRIAANRASLADKARMFKVRTSPPRAAAVAAAVSTTLACGILGGTWYFTRR